MLVNMTAVSQDWSEFVNVRLAQCVRVSWCLCMRNLEGCSCLFCAMMARAASCLTMWPVAGSVCIKMCVCVCVVYVCVGGIMAGWRRVTITACDPETALHVTNTIIDTEADSAVINVCLPWLAPLKLSQSGITGSVPLIYLFPHSSLEYLILINQSWYSGVKYFPQTA